MPTGVYDRTKSKPNIGMFKRGEHRSPDTEFLKGQHISPETEFGSIPPLPFAQRIKNLDDYRRKQSQSHKGQHSSPETEFRRGNHYSPETEFRLGQSQIYIPLGSNRPEFSGSNHPNWKGGISPIKSILRGSGQYHGWRVAVFRRDNYTCQICGKRGGRLQAHHDLPFVKFPLFLLDVSNGKTLCYKCHRNLHFGEGGDANA